MKAKIINTKYMPISTVKKNKNQGPKFSKHEAHLLAKTAS